MRVECLQIEAASALPDSGPTVPSVAGYLPALALLCMECADRPELLPVFFRIVAMVPGTIAELRRLALSC